MSSDPHPSVDLINDSYEETKWKFHYGGGLGVADLPTSQEDSISVRLDFEAENLDYTPRTLDARISHNMLFETIPLSTGPKTVYTGILDLSSGEFFEIYG